MVSIACDPTYFVEMSPMCLYLKWLNSYLIFSEDNNTRVLFERVLSSGGLTSQLSVDVWNRFLEFESNIGDLSSIVKVERRRSSVLETVTLLITKIPFFTFQTALFIRNKMCFLIYS